VNGGNANKIMDFYIHISRPAKIKVTVSVWT